MEHDMNMTLQEVADELGITKGRVWQIERDALKKLKKRLSSFGISYEDVFGEKKQKTH